MEATVSDNRQERPRPRPDDHLFAFQLECGSCGAKKQMRAPAYPWPIGKPLPVTSRLDAANCHRCGRAEMIVKNGPPQNPTPTEPPGWAKDPRK